MHLKTRMIVESLSFVTKALQKRHKSWFEEGIDMMEKFKKEGELNQTEFKRMKELLQRGIEEAWTEIIRAPYFHSGRWENLPKDVRDVGDLNTGLHLAESSLKKAKKLPDHEAVRKAIQFFETLVPLSKDIADLKTKIVKKKRAKRDAEAAAEANDRKLASHKDVKRVRKSLTQITERLKKDIQKENEEWLTSVVMKWKKQYNPENDKTGPREYYRNNAFNASIIERVTERKGYRDPYTMKSGYKKIIEEEAEKITKSMIENFIEKNTSKLAEILYRKNQLTTITLRRTYTDRGTIEGTMELDFKDGSSFVVDSKLVQSYSKYGKPFVRYPTTFHDVKMPDGSKMKGRASESRMEKEFATV